MQLFLCPHSQGHEYKIIYITHACSSIVNSQISGFYLRNDLYKYTLILNLMLGKLFHVKTGQQNLWNALYTCLKCPCTLSYIVSKMYVCHTEDTQNVIRASHSTAVVFSNTSYKLKSKLECSLQRVSERLSQ